MTKMFIANATLQVQQFQYQVVETDQLFTKEIPPGQQRQLDAKGGDFNTLDVERVVKHHSRYGLIPESEVGKVAKFSGMCYSLDKPVSFARLSLLANTNRGIKYEEGKEIRTAQGIAINANLERQLQESGGSEVLQQFAYEVEEVTPAQVRGLRRETESMARALAEERSFAEGVRVTRDAEPPKGARRRR